jgi:hypothetical protein
MVLLGKVKRGMSDGVVALCRRKVWVCGVSYVDVVGIGGKG